MTDRPDWNTDGRDWPQAEFSRFVDVAGLRWHVQDSGPSAARPVLLLLHGAGAATHSWRGLWPRLVDAFRVVAMDLPGHGFTARPSGPLTLPTMAASVAGLLQFLEIEPDLVVAHSAGAAVALRLALDGATAEAPIVAINGALKPFAGAAAPLFRGLALGLAGNPLAVALFAAAGRDAGRVERMIRGTGSRIDAAGIDFYARLMRRRGHVGATLAMMADWDVTPVLKALPGLKAPLVLLAGSGDLAVPPSVAHQVAASAPGVQVVDLPGLGHLAHEEAPGRVVEVILRAARDHGVLKDAAS